MDARKVALAALVLALCVFGDGGAYARPPTPASAPPADASEPVGPAPDYRRDADWLCRPGKEALCESGLDADRAAGGGFSREAFTPAANPKVDCFYVYPTVSRDQTPFSDLNPGPEEVNVVKAQAARFSSRCRVFAPLYRQVTLYAMGASMRGGAPTDWRGAYRDVLAAWKDYLAHDNKGRGVILMGHSQGSILLGRLIAEEIDGKPIAERLVAAYLPGHPELTVPVGADVGGAFKAIPLCRGAGQTGCVVAWSSYDASAMPPTRACERTPAAGGQRAVCVNPAALVSGAAAGPTPLDAYLPHLTRPHDASPDDLPFIHDVGGYEGVCVTDGKGSVLEVSVTPGPGADLRQRLLTSVGGRRPTWGLHALDVSLLEGDMLKLVDRQSAAYLAKAR